MTERIDILTAGGTIRVDLTATLAEGLIDIDDAESAGDALRAVRGHIEARMALIDADGGQVLITPTAVLAMSYRRD